MGGRYVKSIWYRWLSHRGLSVPLLEIGLPTRRVRIVTLHLLCFVVCIFTKLLVGDVLRWACLATFPPAKLLHLLLKRTRNHGTEMDYYNFMSKVLPFTFLEQALFTLHLSSCASPAIQIQSLSKWQLFLRILQCVTGMCGLSLMKCHRNISLPGFSSSTRSCPHQCWPIFQDT